MWFHFSVLCRACVRNLFIVSQDFKEEGDVFRHTLRTYAFDVSLLFLIELVSAVYIVVKQELNSICTLFLDAFCRPNIQAIRQAFSASCIVASFFIGKEKTSIWIKRFCSWKTILRVKEHR